MLFAVCCLLFAGCCLLVAGRWLLGAVCCLLFAGCWLLVAGCCLLFAVCCLLFFVWCLLVAGCWLLVAVCCLLFAVCCLPFAVCWLLVAGCCLLFAVCWLLFGVCGLLFVVRLVFSVLGCRSLVVVSSVVGCLLCLRHHDGADDADDDADDYGITFKKENGGLATFTFEMFQFVVRFRFASPRLPPAMGATLVTLARPHRVTFHGASRELPRTFSESLGISRNHEERH